MTREDLRNALTNPNVAAFLAVIRAGETSNDPSAYNELFGGEHFDSYADHPRKVVVRGSLRSTAAGAYQVLARTFDGVKRQYGFSDFSPATQDEIAVALIAGRHALEAVIDGRLSEAIRLCNKEWASLPGSPYGQPTRTLEQATQTFIGYGGTLAEAGAPRPETLVTKEPKVPIFLALLPLIQSLIPALGALGSGSEVQQRNIKAASAVTDALVTAAAPGGNLQEAVENMQKDPAALQAATEAVHSILPEIMEAGGGGIKGARDQVIATSSIPLRAQAPFVLAILFFMLIGYVVVLSMLKFDWIADITPETRAGVIMFVLGTIGGGIVGMYYGTMHKPESK